MPDSFCFLCGRGQQGGVLKHIKDYHFLVFLAVRDFVSKSLGRLRSDLQLSVQWILICFVIEVSREEYSNLQIIIFNDHLSRQADVLKPTKNAQF